MADTTQDQHVEQQRFIANTEQQDRNITDEDLIQDIAEFIHLSAGQANNKNLQNELMNLSNQLVTNKSALASTPDEQGQVPMSPEEALAAQGGLEGGQPPIAGGEQGLPPEIQQALAQQGGQGLPPI